MKAVYLIFTLIVFSFKVESTHICDSDFCICRHNNKSDRDLLGETIACTYDPSVLKRSFDLPDTVSELDLSRNNLTKIESSNILTSKTLEELFLNSNKISEISAGAFRLPKLKRLDLSDNELEFLHSDTFNNIKQLEYLNLANNKFTTFAKISFHHLSDLKEIVLDNNDLGHSLERENLFDRSGYGLSHKIKSLSINGISLHVVPENFFVDAFDLKRLSIANNNLTDIFELPFTLEYLDLSDNPITQISEEDFSDLMALKELKLNNVLIKEIPAYVFASLHALKYLELERNQNLVNFSPTAFGHEVLEDADDFPLEKLSLKGSRLTGLDKQLEVPFGQLIRLDLQGNFWNCDCNLKWIKKLQIHPEDKAHLRCFTPQQLYNSRIFDVKEKYFKCADNSRHIGITIAVISLCVLLTSTAIWIFMFLPKSQSRCNFANNIYPTAGYSVLPVHSSLRDPS